MMTFRAPSHLGGHAWSHSRRLPVACGAKAKKAPAKPAGKGFGSTAVSPPSSQRRSNKLEIRLLDDLPTVAVDPEDTDINEDTRDKCLFYMNKTEELCDRMPKILDHAWAQATAQRINDCVSRPLTLSSSGHEAALHVLDITHEDFVNPALIAAVWDKVKPDAVALDVPPAFIKSFTRICKLMDPQLLGKLLATPLNSLSGALNHANDFDRVRWHHTILLAMSQGSISLAVDEASWVNVFANRDLQYAECITVAHLAAAGAAGAGAAGAAARSAPVPVHGIDIEDDATQTRLSSDEFWSAQDVETYRKNLVGAVDWQLQLAVNTWLQGIPTGTVCTAPRQRFVLGRLEQAMTRQQEEAFLATDAKWRASHDNPQVREQMQLRNQQSAHLLAKLSDLSTGKLGGKRCGRILAVLGGGHAARIRAMQLVGGAGTGAGAGVNNA